MPFSLQQNYLGNRLFAPPAGLPTGRHVASATAEAKVAVKGVL